MYISKMLVWNIIRHHDIKSDGHAIAPGKNLGPWKPHTTWNLTSNYHLYLYSLLIKFIFVYLDFLNCSCSQEVMNILANTDVS